MMTLFEEQIQQNQDDYQAYLLTKELEGRRCPDLDGIVSLMKGKYHEKVQSKKRESA